MLPVAADFLDVLKGSHQQVCRVDAYRGGRLVSPALGLPVTGGQVSLTAGQAIRAQVSVTIADPDGVWAPKADGPLSPYGSELNIRLGVAAGRTYTLLSVVWAPITVARTSQRWQPYTRVDKVVQVSRGASNDITATDRAEIVGGAKFMARTQPANSTVFAEIASLLRGIVPYWSPPAGVADKAIPTGITYADDRLAAIGDLAGVVNCDFIFRGDGVATLTPRAAFPIPTSSVWALPSGPEGQPPAVILDRELNRDGVYNGVIARGTSFNGTAIIGQAVIGDGPLRWNGPLGQIPYFVDSPTIGTQADADTAAAGQLAKLQAERAQTLTVETVSNPALEPGDVVSLALANGSVNGLVTALSWPLTPGPMSLTLSVDPTLLAQAV